jgi:hypothetical protein
MVASAVLAERLLLAIYAYGTNTGIRAVASVRFATTTLVDDSGFPVTGTSTDRS